MYIELHLSILTALDMNTEEVSKHLFKIATINPLHININNILMKNNNIFEEVREKGGIILHLQISLTSVLGEDSWILRSASASICHDVTHHSLWKIPLYAHGRKSEKRQKTS